jgi:sulfite reductase (ferredoxin)
VADIGFYGNNRKINNRYVPHFQLVLGGQWTENAGAYGLAVGSIPSKAVPGVIDALLECYVQKRADGELFRDFIERLGKRSVRELVKPFMEVPAYSQAPEFYSDWHDVREFSIGDLGIGECAGEVVSLFGIEVLRAESQAFEAQVALDDGDFAQADDLAYRAMLSAARALVRTEYIDVSENPDDIVAQFRTRFYDTERFFDKYMRGKFAHYLLDRHQNGAPAVERPAAAHAVEEAQLFIEAAHACEARSAAAAPAAAAAGVAS